MRNIFNSKLVQIEVTNACVNQCANCTRCVGHHPKPYFMELEKVREILDSLEGFGGEVGLMGGEPALHPQFTEICKLFQEKLPKSRRGLWTSGYKWEEYRQIREETFDPSLIVYNEHSTDGGMHQPLLASMKDLVKDKKLRKELKDNCWAQRRWETCSVTPQGAYFCEVAATLDILFNNGKNAVPITPGWWKDTKIFSHQYKICEDCGAPVPIGGMSDRASFDLISKSNLKRLKKLGSPKVLAKNYGLYEKEWTKEEIIKKYRNWEPWNWRTFHAFGPEDYGKKT